MLKSKVKSGELSPEEVIVKANERFKKVHSAAGDLVEFDLEKLSAFERFIDDEFWKAYLDARKNKRGTKDEQEFEMLERENLTKLRESVVAGNYKPSRGIAFVNFRPVIREIYAAPLKGIVIGNLTSQLLSNLYLSKLDWFIFQELGWKRYGRYVDDFVIIVTEEELSRALSDKPKIVEFLAGLGLKIHPTKTKVTEVHQGIQFLGIVIYPTFAVLAKRFRRNFWVAAVETGMGYRDMESVISYVGLSSHYDTRKLWAKMRKYWDLETLEAGT